MDIIVSDVKKTRDEPISELEALRHRLDELEQANSDRELAEDILRQSEKHYRSLVEDANDIVFTFELASGLISSVNAYAEETLGYKREDVIGQVHFSDLIHPDDFERGIASLQERLTQNKRDPNFPFRLRRADGSCMDAELNGAVICNSAGDPHSFLGVIRDISTRKRAEEALEESLSVLRATLESTADGILVADTLGNIQNYNQKLLDMWRIPFEINWSDESNDIRMHMLNLAKDPVKAVRDTQELYDHPEKENFAILELKDGRIFERYSKPQKIWGKTVGIVISFRDVTESRQAERLLRESEAKYRTLFEESINAVFISMPGGKVLDINPAGVKMFGYSSKEEALKADISRDTYLNPQDREAYIKALVERGFVEDYEVALKRKDGQRIDVLVTATIVCDEKGDPIAFRGMMRDITERKRLEQQLIQAQKMESIGTLAGGIAHDFNNLLGGILGFASLIKAKISERHPIFGYANTIETSATRAAELTSQLLAFARGGKYETKPVNLNKTVRETLEIINSTFDKSMEIETDLHAHLPTVEADAGQIQQILLNLCMNAYDAMDGGGKLTIETYIEDITDSDAEARFEVKPGQYVVLSVDDTGVGIGKDKLQKIFEPFFTTKKEGKGTGLGLAMVYGVVKNHGGFVNVYSELCVGSTFKVYLPSSEKPEWEEAPELETPMGADELILVVDDEESIRLLAKEMLESCGYRVLLAENGFEAVEVYEKHRNKIEAVILDMVMPKMGGREAFLELKALNPQVKALLSTGYSQDGKAQAILDVGVKGFLQKPYRLDALLSKVRGVLDSKV